MGPDKTTDLHSLYGLCCGKYCVDKVSTTVVGQLKSGDEWRLIMQQRESVSFGNSYK